MSILWLTTDNEKSESTKKKQFSLEAEYPLANKSQRKF